MREVRAVYCFLCQTLRFTVTTFRLTPVCMNALMTISWWLVCPEISILISVHFHCGIEGNIADNVI